MIRLKTLTLVSLLALFCLAGVAAAQEEPV
jgi:hypothetical protein